MKNVIKIIVVVIVSIGFITCKKNKMGGKATLQGVVEHHSKPIPNAYVYIKYNATEFPGEDYTKYDTYVKADESGNYTINFYKGTYYVYAVGYDYDIPSPYIVKGGLSVTLRNKENVTKNISVTEQ